MDHIPKPWRDARVVLKTKPSREPNLAKSYPPPHKSLVLYAKNPWNTYGQIYERRDFD